MGRAEAHRSGGDEIRSRAVRYRKTWGRSWRSSLAQRPQPVRPHAAGIDGQAALCLDWRNDSATSDIANYRAVGSLCNWAAGAAAAAVGGGRRFARFQHLQLRHVSRFPAAAGRTRYRLPLCRRLRHAVLRPCACRSAANHDCLRWQRHRRRGSAAAARSRPPARNTRSAIGAGAAGRLTPLVSRKNPSPFSHAARKPTRVPAISGAIPR